ncbi:unnamed protein product [Haemonchus placei]|uniref:Secretoglobin family 3A member 1 n=1 Tax=Haemonchus placei TaxID=6290 RepID=A0A0N4W1A3_HAEPC|nr:unnamed protein product [Haemonchus placei]
MSLLRCHVAVVRPCRCCAAVVSGRVIDCCCHAMSSLAPSDPKKQKQTSSYAAQIVNFSSDVCFDLFTELQSILEKEAPEAAPLMKKLVGLLTPNPAEIVAAEAGAICSHLGYSSRFASASGGHGTGGEILDKLDVGARS